MNYQNEMACTKIQEWLESRESERTAWKRVSSLAALFGAKRLTSSVKNRITSALLHIGIRLEPPLSGLGLPDVNYISSSTTIISPH